MDPRQAALSEVDAILGRARREALDAATCARLVELVPLCPGRLRDVAQSLSAQRTSAAVDALMQLPPHVPGVVEGVFQAVAHGAVRRRPSGADCPHMLALDFRHSRARDFDELVERARLVFRDALSRLEVEGRSIYRFELWEGRGTFAGRAAAAAHDVVWLHRRLSKLRGTRLWLNGWSFPSDGPFGPTIQVHFVRAWLMWAAQQTHTRT